jgi:hypothetical protein
VCDLHDPDVPRSLKARSDGGHDRPFLPFLRVLPLLVTA